MKIESLETLLKLRPYSPYRFGGKWFCGQINGQWHAQRKQIELERKAAKAGLTALTIAVIE